jgi:hypothetical protein
MDCDGKCTALLSLPKRFINTCFYKKETINEIEVKNEAS